MGKPQVMVVHVHEGKKLFHVSVHNEDTNPSNKQAATVAAKARTAWNNLNAGKRSDNERTFAGGLVLAMVNTDFTGWTTTEIDAVYPDLKEASNAKTLLIDEWTDRGYSNVGVRNRTTKEVGTGDVPAGWASKFNVNTMTLDKLNKRIDWINTSLQMNISGKVRNDALMSVIGANGTVDNMATLLRFIRTRMNLP